MNPFTESTVARPLAQPSSPAANDAAAPPEAPNSPLARPKIRTRLFRPKRVVRLRPPGADALRFAGLRIPDVGQAARRQFMLAALGLLLTVVAPVGWAVNVNSATVQQLSSVNGIGPKTAQLIIDERTRGGSFESFDDLAERVKGIGPKKARSLQAAGLSVGGQAQGTPSSAPGAAVAARKPSR